MKKQLAIVVAFAVLSTFQASPLYAGDKLGKLFIKASVATVDGQQFTDQGKEDSVKDLKERAGKFILVDSEKEADYLLLVVERKRNSGKSEIAATLSFRNDGQWKPGTRLVVDANTWSYAATRLMVQVNGWVKGQGK